MEIESNTALAFLVFALPISLYTFYVDMKSKRISNLTVWALFAAYVVVGLLTLPFMDFIWRFSSYAIVFAVLIVMWLLRQVGAGDVKLASVTALFVDPGDAPAMIWIATACILAATISVLIVRHTPLKNLAPDWAAWRLRVTDGSLNVGGASQMTLPMGTGIGLMLCTYLAMGVLYGA